MATLISELVAYLSTSVAADLRARSVEEKNGLSSSDLRALAMLFNTASVLLSGDNETPGDQADRSWAALRQSAEYDVQMVRKARTRQKSGTRVSPR